MSSSSPAGADASLRQAHVSELVDEVGYERLTTKAIAARAGTSIGAFYQFFANKDDVIDALALRLKRKR